MSDCLTKAQLAQAYQALRPSAEVQARINAEINAVANTGGVSTLVVKKKICGCADHQGDNRFETFHKTGPMVIGRCFTKCPFCDCSPGNSSSKPFVWHHSGATLRKHISTRHCGKPGYEGLWVVPANDITRNNLLTTTFCIPNSDGVKQEDPEEWTDTSESDSD